MIPRKSSGAPDSSVVLGSGIMTMPSGLDPELKLQLERSSVFHRCVEDSNDAIMICDRKGCLAYVNSSWQRVYGYSAEEAIGETPRLLHSGVQDAGFYREMWARITDPSVGFWKGELVNRAKDGSMIPVLLSITPFKSELGEILGYMGIAVDISWRLELEAKVAHQDRLATIGTLVSGLAHEIGTPLGVIRGRAEIIQMQSENTSQRRSVEVILGQTDRISKIIQSLLKLSRGSKEKARVERVKLRELVEEVISLLSGPVRESKVDLHCDIDAGLQVQADFSRFEQILMNLIVNAIHAIESRVREQADASRVIRISASPWAGSEPGQWVEVQVADSGCGIPAENLKQIFQPFFTTKEIGQGTGLGLAISLKLLQEMRGTIDVESDPGKGTTFMIRLPRA